MMYPLQVEVDESKILKVKNLYKSAYREIISTISGATNFGVANRKAILGQITQILRELGEDVDKFTAEEIEKLYKSGANDAIKQLNNIDASLSGAQKNFSLIHKDAIMALTDETATAFGEGLAGIARSARLLLGKATRELLTQKIAEGIISGQALKDVAKTIKGTLQEQGLFALKDKAGRSWTLDRYSEMLFRTKAVEARNRGMINRMVEQGYDLVQVSDHNSEHEECAVWEGKILSVSGETKGYPTLATAESMGLFHPNCKHAINIMIPSLARKTQAYNNSVETMVIDQS